MGIVCNYIRCIHTIRIAIWTQKLDVVECLDKMKWHVVMRVCWHDWRIIIMLILIYILSIQTPWNILFSKPWVHNVYSTMVI